MKFWLGTHEASWLKIESNLFVSRRRLFKRRTLPVAAGAWALDSGGFTELNLFGGWKTKEREYARDVLRFQDEIGNLEWAAPMDWMCEPFMLQKTGFTVEQHQRLTVKNFLHLRNVLGTIIIPVLQGWELDDYLRCVDMYDQAGVDLYQEDLVGLGSVCRRQNTQEAAHIVRALSDLPLHGFGMKTSGLMVYADALASADSMAWSYRARRDHPLRGCTHQSCANCIHYARRWRDRIAEDILGQTRLELV